MPKTKLGSRLPPHAKLGQLLAGTVALRGETAADVAAILDCCENTARSRIRNPGDLTVDELTRLGRKMGIPIADLRDAIRYQ